MNRRHFTIALLAGVGLAACGRRGPLEPPPYTAQGREWQRRQGRNPDGTRREAGQPGQERQAQGSVQEGLQRDTDARTTVDVEGQLEGTRVEGVPRQPSDPTQGPVTAESPGASPGVSPTGGARRRPPGILPPKQPFILDPLL